MIDNTETSSSQEQIFAENQMILNEHIKNIYGQFASVQPIIHPQDYINRFITSYFELPEDYDLETNTIYNDSRLTDLDHADLLKFVSRITNIIEKTFGIELIDTDMRLVNNVYQVLVVNMFSNLIYYFKALQKLDEDFSEDLPNYSELSFESFKKINPNISGLPQYNQIQEYVNYIVKNHIYSEYFFELALFESAGNVDLANLYNETINGRIKYDNEFFALKIEKIFSSEEYIDSFITKLIEVGL